MKNAVIYVAAGAGALALALLATMILEQSAADDSSQIEMQADFSRDAVRETVVETIERVQRDRLAKDDTRAGRYAATLQAELSGIRGDLAGLMDRIEKVANTEPTIEGGDIEDIPNHARIAAIVAETILAEKEQQSREREAKRQERDIARKEKLLERRSQLITKRLELREDQVPSVLAAYEDYDSKRKDLFRDLKADGERLSGTKIKDALKGLDDGMNSAMSRLLDESQYERYLSNRSEGPRNGEQGQRGNRRLRSGERGEGASRGLRGGGSGGRRRGRDR